MLHRQARRRAGGAHNPDLLRFCRLLKHGLGAGVCLGFTFPRNFRLPYTSLSITEFWRRWHISLSSWLRDYLHFPWRQQGNGRRNLSQPHNGFPSVRPVARGKLDFILWGVWHGLFLVIERAGLNRLLQALPNPARWAYAMAVVMFGWVLFRASDLASALAMYRGMLGFNGASEPGFEVEAAWQLPILSSLLFGVLLQFFPVSFFFGGARDRNWPWPKPHGPSVFSCLQSSGWALAATAHSFISGSKHHASSI